MTRQHVEAQLAWELHTYHVQKQPDRPDSSCSLCRCYAPTRLAAARLARVATRLAQYYALALHVQLGWFSKHPKLKFAKKKLLQSYLQRFHSTFEG